MLLRSVAKKNNLVEKCNILGAASSEKLCMQYLLSVMVLYHVSAKLTTFFSMLRILLFAEYVTFNRNWALRSKLRVIIIR